MSSNRRWKFEPSDFWNIDLSPRFIADRANSLLDQWRKEATVVNGKIKETNSGWDCAWTVGKSSADTHRALLIDIEPLHKEPCKHEPTFHDNDVDACKHCGVKLKATWEASND